VAAAPANSKWNSDFIAGWKLYHCHPTRSGEAK
jgi:hypothetical protein